MQKPKISVTYSSHKYQTVGGHKHTSHIAWKPVLNCIFCTKSRTISKYFCGEKDQTDPGVIDLFTLKESLISTFGTARRLGNGYEQVRVSSIEVCME